MRRGIIASTAAAAMLLASCSGGSSGDGGVPTTILTGVEESTPVPSVSVPTPDAAQQTALITGLSAIDPGLVANAEQVVSRARSTCLDIKEGKGADTVVRNVEMRFEGGTVTDLSTAQATAIVAVVRSTFCS